MHNIVSIVSLVLLASFSVEANRALPVPQGESHRPVLPRFTNLRSSNVGTLPGVFNVLDYGGSFSAKCLAFSIGNSRFGMYIQ